jgi:hypothetical protein
VTFAIARGNVYGAAGEFEGAVSISLGANGGDACGMYS